MDMANKIKGEALRDAQEYRDIVDYLADRYNETIEEAAERVEICAEMVRENPESAGVAAEFLGLSSRQLNLCLGVLGVIDSAAIEAIVAEEARMFDEAGEAIRSAVIAVSEYKGYNIAAPDASQKPTQSDNPAACRVFFFRGRG